MIIDSKRTVCELEPILVAMAFNVQHGDDVLLERILATAVDLLNQLVACFDSYILNCWRWRVRDGIATEVIH